ncbi:MAG TPA: zf-HC2 domain-containing protein [Nocardioides sp.]|nr:zf-HC2 domain-containing protein [Nocardioides sp.]
MPGVWWLGGHLGAAVSALLDGQLDEESAERAWAHVAGCVSCRRLVEREGWVKRRLAEMAAAAPGTPQPPSDLLGSLYDLEPVAAASTSRDHADARAAWAAVEEIERRDRPRRRAALAAAGVGSVSAAVLGLSTLGAAPLGIGGAPVQPPSSALTRSTPSGTTAPSAPTPVRVRTSATAPAATSTSGAPTAGPFSGWQLRTRSGGANRAVPVQSPR